MLRSVCQISGPGHLEVNTLSERKIFTPCTWQESLQGFSRSLFKGLTRVSSRVFYTLKLSSDLVLSVS